MSSRPSSKPITSFLSYKNTVLLVFCFLTLAILLFFPDTALPLVRESILIWYQSLLPTLFPAMILSNIILYLFLNFKKFRFRIPILSSVYHLDSYGCLVLLLGFLCGFPIGAYLCAKLVKERQLSQEQGQYLLGFCNHLSPVFLIGIYCRLFPILPKISVALLFYGCPLLYGFILYQCTIRRHLKKTRPDAAVTAPRTLPRSPSERSIAEMIDYAISDALSSIVRLAGYIIFFRLLLLPLRLFDPGETCRLLLGSLIEITSGVQAYSQNAGAADIRSILFHTLPLMTFGGICCIGQTICMIRGSGLSIGIYVRDKILQSLLLAVILQLTFPLLT